MLIRMILGVLLTSVMACGGAPERADRAAADSDAAPAAPASPSDDAALLCDRIDDDRALTPPDAEPYDMPDLASLNGERRCVLALAADTPMEDVRRFYRSALANRGYEIADWVDGEGIVEGNLSRTFVRATKPDLHANVTIDEFDPQATPLSDHRIHIKLQFDEMGG